MKLAYIFMCHRLSPPFLCVSPSIHMRVECFTEANSQRSYKRSIQSQIFKNICQQIVGFFGEYSPPSQLSESNDLFSGFSLSIIV